jgi:hypothetical protein
MNRFLSRLILVIGTLLQIAAVASAGTLDDYYLQQFGEPNIQQLQKAVLSVSTDVQESAVRCGTPLKHGLRRDWKLLEQSTQKVLAKQLAYPSYSWPNEQIFTSASGHFMVHYTTSGTNAPPLADANGNSVPDWVETVAATFENVYARYQSMGYQPAPTTAGAPYDIYLSNLATQSYYGVTTSNSAINSATYPNAYTSWMELDNNFTDSLYINAPGGPYTPLQSLQITAAHEYHHAIQYGYTVLFDIWYAEATSTWMEDELYDGVNQLYNYLPNWFKYSTSPLNLTVKNDATSTGAGYGRWIFNRFLAEKHGSVMIRQAWESVGTTASSGGNDIQMIPVLENLLVNTYGTTLGTDFFEFTKRVYAKSWTSHVSEIIKIHSYTPVSTYAVSSSVANQTAIPLLTLPAYSFAYYKFTPAAGTTLTLSITKSSGVQTALFKKVAGVITEIPAAGNGSSYSVSDFRSTDEVALLVTNASATDGLTASISADGTLELTASTEQLPTNSSPSNTTSSSGNANSCFIATAAYGSYLHPQVKQLRLFRDEYLLTNAPGRAFVSLYYRFSPPVADVIARHPLLRGVTCLFLTPVVVAVVHPVASGGGLLLAIMLLYRPVRRRFMMRC